MSNTMWMLLVALPCWLFIGFVALRLFRDRAAPLDIWQEMVAFLLGRKKFRGAWWFQREMEKLELVAESMPKDFHLVDSSYLYLDADSEVAAGFSLRFEYADSPTRPCRLLEWRAVEDEETDARFFIAFVLLGDSIMGLQPVVQSATFKENRLPTALLSCLAQAPGVYPRR